MSTNLVVLSGRIGGDPEVKQVGSSNKSVCGFNLAVDSGFGDKKATDWWFVEVWDKTAEAVARLTGKGKRVVVTGRLKQDSWVDSGSGQKRYKTKILASQVDIIDFLDSQADGHSEESADDDIPF